MAKKARKLKETYFTVGRAAEKGVFRDVHTGEFVTRVMPSERVYKKAKSRAGQKIHEYSGAKKAS